MPFDFLFIILIGLLGEKKKRSARFRCCSIECLDPVAHKDIALTVGKVVYFWTHFGSVPTLGGRDDMGPSSELFIISPLLSSFEAGDRSRDRVIFPSVSGHVLKM